MKNFDVIVIGGGPAGYVAAIRAAQLGRKTAVIERRHLGGICLNWGCIPTKALLHAGGLLEEIRHCKSLGIETGGVRIDLGQMVRRSRAVSQQLNRGIGHLLRKNKVTVIDGHASFTGPRHLAVHACAVDKNGAGVVVGQQISDCAAKDIIIATGARARTLPGLEPDYERVVTYHHAMIPTSLPETLLVVGSGAIGVEFASFYCALGVKVIMVEAAGRIMPAEDAEIAGIARQQLSRRGIDIRTAVSVQALSRGKTLTATLSDGGSLTVERVIVAVGVIGNSDDLGLEKIGLKATNGVIAVDGLGRTAQAGVYAIGDVAGPPMLAHKAEHEAVACVEAIAGLEPHPVDRKAIPGCTYSDPQVASIGLTEAQAVADGHKVRVGRFPFAGNGKAVALGKEQGLIKTVFSEQTGALLGAHMVGADVTELVQGFAIAITLETTEAELMRTVFPHPTLSEAMHESVLAAYGRAIHI